ncbi:MAG: cell wall hydrolase/autolysin [Actinomycetia bacterium]|nr:cell wall hydrolase/autolysin [Actinomycetes bacterium]
MEVAPVRHRPVIGEVILALSLGILTGCGGGSTPKTPPVTGDTPGRQEQIPKNRVLAGKTIVLDPGHNGGNGSHPAEIGKMVDIVTTRKECDTTGADTKAGYSEHAFNWDVAKRLERLLQARGATVILTRPNDTGVGPCITERAAIGNRAHAGAALSIHADGAPVGGHGFHIIEPIPISGHNAKAVPASDKLGLALRDAFHRGTGTPYSTYTGKNALNPRNDLGGLNLSTVPKVFIECGNLRNPGDAANLTNPGFRQKIAASLAAGFEAYFS